MTKAQHYAEIRGCLNTILSNARQLRAQLNSVTLDPDSPDHEADEEDLETLRDSAQDIFDEADVSKSLLRELRSRLFQVLVEPAESTSPQTEES